jgi:MarR family transcriptional regulator, lower aerobic nicotinate degradation pathway regulator
MATLRRLAGQPTWILSRANARAHRLLAEAFGAEGVRGYHYRLLAALDERGPASQADLGRVTDIDRSDVVAALDEMVAEGLARRTRDPNDGRRNVVTITARGTRRLEHLDTVLEAVQEEVMGPLSERERTTLLRLLAKLG